jgi:hypothetical protein
MLFYDVDNGIFGDQQISIFAGISLVIGFALVVAVRFGFAKNEDIAAAVTWGMLGNLLGIGFAAISDIWINGFSLPATIVGQFLPAAGPNLIFAAVLVPMLGPGLRLRPAPIGTLIQVLSDLVIGRFFSNHQIPNHTH